MIAGILDAMRSSYPPAVRLVWACLENHANGMRCWRMRHREIAAELHLSRDTVGQGVAILERDGIVRCVRQKRRPTTFVMLRSYPEGCQKPRHEPEVAGKLMPAIPTSTAELMSELPDSFLHQIKTPPVEEEDARTRATAPLAEGEILVAGEGKEARRIEEVVPVSPEPFPDEPPQLDPAEADMIRAAGWDPAELSEEVRNWCNGVLAEEGRAPVSTDWPRVMVRFARKTRPPVRRAPTPHRAGQRDKPERRQRVAVWAYQELLAEHAARQGAAP